MLTNIAPINRMRCEATNRIHQMLARRDATPEWFPDWSGTVCAIVASGASVTEEAVDLLRSRCRVAVVNNNHELAPWADLLYAADVKWWDAYPEAKKFTGLKVLPVVADRTSADGLTAIAAAKRHGLHLVTVLEETDTDADRIMVDRPGMIARGGNSAFQAINLITQFGCRKQIWVGFDFTGEHWHGNHPPPLKNPRQQTLDKWRVRLDSNADVLAALGVEIVNASATSTLTKYQKMSVVAALDRWAN